MNKSSIHDIFVFFLRNFFSLFFFVCVSGNLEEVSGSHLASMITNTSLSQDEVEMIMERLLEKQDLNEEWEMVS